KISTKTKQPVDVAQRTDSTDISGMGSLRLEEKESGSKRSDSEPVLARRPSLEEKFGALKQRSPRKIDKVTMTPASFPVWPGLTGPDASLTENLLKHLAVGSRDSLNIMSSLFEFHRYDQTLLESYIKNKSPDNLTALEIQIKNLAVQGSSRDKA
ncbi:MAG: hypothetical protein H7327_03930, partial [Herminiimonas sp.]|nr:hypothetical protein [Herminiimonas sp.]